MIQVPFRIAHTSDPSKKVAKGYPGALGDAGWTVYNAQDASDARSFMRDNEAARMPCWRRITAELAMVDAAALVARTYLAHKGTVLSGPTGSVSVDALHTTARQALPHVDPSVWDRWNLGERLVAVVEVARVARRTLEAEGVPVVEA